MGRRICKSDTNQRILQIAGIVTPRSVHLFFDPTVQIILADQVTAGKQPLGTALVSDFSG